MRRMAVVRGLASILTGGMALSLRQTNVVLPRSGSGPSNTLSKPGDEDLRRAHAKPLWRKLDKMERQRAIRANAWANPDHDLLTLQSVTPAFRQAIMRDRLREYYSLTDRINDALTEIWEGPLEKVKEAVAKIMGFV